MTSCSLSLRYTLDTDAAGDDARPRFSIEPDAADDHHVKFSASNLRSVDRLTVRWSTAGRMKDDSVKAYLAKIGAKGGKAATAAKAEAARANGAKGGRPKKKKAENDRARNS